MDDSSSGGSECRIMRREAMIIAIRAWEEKAPRFIHNFHRPIKRLACCKELPKAEYGLVLDFRQPKKRLVYLSYLTPQMSTLLGTARIGVSEASTRPIVMRDSYG